ncbi:serine hydrolase domain-containing protein [Winogradskyella sediminis]|uniref:serine hydrolase domain-containing protein n=1 Tax=Winogradskyella sediminis TaxID=1382466 RepID=UPI003AA87090
MSYTSKTIMVLIILFLSQLIFGQAGNIDKETIKKIDSLFNSYHHQKKTGSIISIIKNGKTVYNNKKGLANIEHQIPITDSTAFNIASNSKQFAAFIALLMEEEGKLSFNDDIRKHLPELSHLPKKITIKQLANHTHGLPSPDELAQLKGVETMHHKQVLEMLLNIKQVSFEAGEEHFYNNTGFILLAEIIERVGKKSFKQQLKEKVFVPLKMHNTKVIDNKNTVVKNRAYSYRLQQDSTYITNPAKLSTIGSSGIFTTIDDLGLWVKNYQNTTLGKREFYSKMQAITTLNSGKKTNYGLGLQVDTYKGIDVVFHGGGTESYRSYILHAPKHQLSLVFLSNKGDMSGLDIMYGTLEIILKDFIQEEKTFTMLKGNELKKLEGTYQMFPGKYYNFIVENDKLYFQFFGSTGKYHFPQIGENTFNYPVAHHKIVFYENGLEFKAADMTYYCPKTDVKLVVLENLNLNKFAGTYENIEHNIQYKLVVKNNTLVAIHKNINYDIVLSPLSENSFHSYEAFFGKIEFTSNKNESIESFKVSGQNLKDIVFKKL